VAKDELTVAKINAAVKILEWSKDDLEPGIGGTPTQPHVALADAFKTIYNMISEAVGPGQGDSGPDNNGAEKSEKPVGVAIS
jgi:hypothetical protein